MIQSFLFRFFFSLWAYKTTVSLVIPDLFYVKSFAWIYFYFMRRYIITISLRNSNAVIWNLLLQFWVYRQLGNRKSLENLLFKVFCSYLILTSWTDISTKSLKILQFGKTSNFVILGLFPIIIFGFMIRYIWYISSKFYSLFILLSKFSSLYIFLIIWTNSKCRKS